MQHLPCNSFSWKFIVVMNLDLNIHGITNIVPRMSWQTSNSPIAVQRSILTLPRNTRSLVTTKNDHWCSLTIVRNKQISNRFSVVYLLPQNMSRVESDRCQKSKAADVAQSGRCCLKRPMFVWKRKMFVRKQPMINSIISMFNQNW